MYRPSSKSCFPSLTYRSPMLSVVPHCTYCSGSYVKKADECNMYHSMAAPGAILGRSVPGIAAPSNFACSTTPVLCSLLLSSRKAICPPLRGNEALEGKPRCDSHLRRTMSVRARLTHAPLSCSVYTDHHVVRFHHTSSPKMSDMERSY